jgi:hypothetical protein
MSAGRAATGIGEFVVGVSHLEWWVGDAGACARAFEPLGFVVVGRREPSAGRGPRAVAVRTADARCVFTEHRDADAPTVADVAWRVTDVGAAEQVALARGALPVRRDRAALLGGRRAVGGPENLVHSLVGPGQWLSAFEPVAAREDGRHAVDGFGAVRLAVDGARLADWRAYYQEVFGGYPGVSGRSGDLTVGDVAIELQAVEARGHEGVHTVTFATAGLEGLRAVAEGQGPRLREHADGTYVESPDLAALLGTRILLTPPPRG